MRLNYIIQILLVIVDDTTPQTRTDGPGAHPVHLGAEDYITESVEPESQENYIEDQDDRK